MRISPIRLTGIIATIAASLILGCVPGLKSIKPFAGEDRATAVGDRGKTKTTESQTGRGTGKDTKPGLPPLDYTPPPPPDDEKLSEKPIDLHEQDEVNSAAREFAKNVSGVKHIKTCYSKLYGGWYLFLYVKKGKKISLHQYSWNEETKEWEISYHLKEVAAKELETHLKGEVHDEKCFVLK